MIISVSEGATGTLRAVSQEIEYLVVPTLNSEDAASTPGSFYDAKTLTNVVASTWLEYDFSFPLDSGATLSNQSPGVLSVTGNHVSRAASGIGYVNIVQGDSARSVACDVTLTGGSTYTVFDGYETGTVSKALYDEIATRLDVLKDTAYFTAQNHTTAIYPRNPDCWLAGIGLECVAVASKAVGGEWTRQGAPILIAPQVVAMCNHFSRSVGSLVRWADAAGNVVTRTITGLATAHATAGDSMIGVLDSPVTGIDPCPVVGPWIEQDPTAFGSSQRSSYIGGAGFYMDQFGSVYAVMFGTTQLSYGFAASGTYQGEALTNVPTEIPVQHSVTDLGAEFADFVKTAISGDSGSFVGVIVGGAPALLLTWHYPSSGTPFFGGDRLTLMIESAKTNAGIVGAITMPTVAPDPTI